MPSCSDSYKTTGYFRNSTLAYADNESKIREKIKYGRYFPVYSISCILAVVL